MTCKYRRPLLPGDNSCAILEQVAAIPFGRSGHLGGWQKPSWKFQPTLGNGGLWKSFDKFWVPTKYQICVYITLWTYLYKKLAYKRIARATSRTWNCLPDSMHSFVLVERKWKAARNCSHRCVTTSADPDSNGALWTEALLKTLSNSTCVLISWNELNKNVTNI